MIKNRSELITQARDGAERRSRRDMLDILEYALEKSDPFYLTLQALKKIKLKKYHRVFVIGAGKGTYRMARAVEGGLKNKLTGGWICVPEAIKDGHLKKIKITLAGHPFPDQGSVCGAQRILDTIRLAGKDDLVLGLFSGGASALMAMPVKGISLADKIEVTKLLLRSGAKIQEVNAVRKHLSQVKGGRIVESAKYTNLISLYLSDVAGNDLSAVGSGPTVPDKTTFKDAIKILKKYKIWNRAPKSVRAHLEQGARGQVAETLKKLPEGVKNIIIGSHKTLAEAALSKARKLGLKPVLVSDHLEGDTEKWGRELIKKAGKAGKAMIWIAAGETTFKVRTSNPGGRNHQMGLAVLSQGIKPGTAFVSFDSDGVDGVSDGEAPVGGVIVDSAIVDTAKKLGLNVKRALTTNDSYNFFKQAGGQIKTGYVGTNLGDIILVK